MKPIIALGDDLVNILSVDDVLVVRKIIKKVVEGMGGKLLEASSGTEAFEIMSANDKIDLILLDWNMPQMDGFEFLSRKKNDERYRHIPVIMVSNENEKEKVIRAVQAGASNYLSKPFSEEDLTRKIVECLGLGYETLLTKVFSKAVVNLMEYTSGTKVTESKPPEDTRELTPGWLFGQALVMGQKKAVLLISMAKETAFNIHTAVCRKNEDGELSPGILMSQILDSFFFNVQESLSEANIKINLTAPFIFSGAIEKNTYSTQMTKVLSAAKRYNSGDMTVELRIIYYC